MINWPWKRNLVVQTSDQAEREAQILLRAQAIDELMRSNAWQVLVDVCHETSDEKLATAKIGPPHLYQHHVGAAEQALDIPRVLIEYTRQRDMIVSSRREAAAQRRESSNNDDIEPPSPRRRAQRI